MPVVDSSKSVQRRIRIGRKAWRLACNDHLSDPDIKNLHTSSEGILAACNGLEVDTDTPGCIFAGLSHGIRSIHLCRERMPPLPARLCAFPGGTQSPELTDNDVVR